MENPMQAQQMAANIFSDMVMEEAIKDKTIQVQQQMKDAEGNAIQHSGDHVHGKDCDHSQHQPNKQDSDDEFFDDEEEKIMRDIREQRLSQMKNQYQEKQENLIKGHGQYTEIKEDEFLANVTKSKFVVCHFYHKDFERCKIVDMHLRNIARNHVEARFLYLNAEQAPFFIKKLQVQVLPTMICFIDGIAVDRIVGFEDLGARDDFPQISLTRRLIRSGVLKPLTKAEKGQINIRRGGNDSEEDSGDDI
ncbi:phosducin-like protein 3 isoform 1 [Stylonychia lemnae]|uniref:Phosducin-like protein 3 isoform 1 n=1 Tax=Stylonychia lemnae TaxID=5949 RepID=A0A077ZT00_STYLE|nr:phosducin-like protein 3 isoform 1 [Stylonychia lemnae]|eukprot:CDW72684.1 phosducin-like protein 3 isoform 1 [Stylonychia lemnae]